MGAIMVVNRLPVNWSDHPHRIADISRSTDQTIHTLIELHRTGWPREQLARSGIPDLPTLEAERRRREAPCFEVGR
jgi:hypothetical protein